MSSSSKKTLPLSDEKKRSKVKRKSAKSISADLESNFNDLDFSAMDSLVNKPIIKELAEKMTADPEFNQLAEQLRRTIPTALMKGMFPEFDPEQYINKMRQILGNPELKEAREKFVNHLLRDPQTSLGSPSCNHPAPIG